MSMTLISTNTLNLYSRSNSCYATTCFFLRSNGSTNASFLKDIRSANEKQNDIEFHFLRNDRFIADPKNKVTNRNIRELYDPAYVM